MPVYLQVDLSKAKAISKLSNIITSKSKLNTTGSVQEMINKIGTVEPGSKKEKKKKKRNVAKPMSAYDLTDQLIKSDYFLDVNPRNLRRLINIIALTGRLLRAYHIYFNWRMLASWIYLVEQWPYRCSWIVMHYEENENEFSDETSFVDIYESIKNRIPLTNEPMLDLDRNARKFEQFLQNCEPKLTCTILKKILPCTCNLDPYLIKLIKDSIDANFEKTLHQQLNSNPAFLNQTNLDNYNTIQNFKMPHMNYPSLYNNSQNVLNGAYGPSSNYLNYGILIFYFIKRYFK